MKATTARANRVIGRGVLAAALAIGLFATACSASDPTGTAASASAKSSARGHGHGAEESAEAVELRHDMRKLWEDHVTWTRQFIVSAIADLPDTEAATARLLQNQTDIGDAVAEYYGDDAGAALTQLLREHILVAADLLAAAKAGDTALVEEHSAAWDANAKEIAAFLGQANPAWTADVLTEMMREHLDGTLAEATARLAGDWEADVAAYDRVHVHILTMADALTAGIVEQFPERFAD